MGVSGEEFWERSKWTLFVSFVAMFFQGSWVGLRNFNRLGIRAAGLKRSLGFVLQPVENWPRYPEFYAVRSVLPSLNPQDLILDVGSPKMFGVLLAQKTPGHFFLTDIWEPAIREFQAIVSSIKTVGKVKLQCADATDLRDFSSGTVSLVYSISVLEHIPADAAGEFGLSRALKEFSRVLRPGGLAVVSVPLAQLPRDDFKHEAVYATEHSGEAVFFQHVFDTTQIMACLRSTPDFEIVQSLCIRWKMESPLVRLWSAVPQKIRGALGIVNLLIANFAFEMRPLNLAQNDFHGVGDALLVLKKRGQ